MQPQYTPAQTARFWSKVIQSDDCWTWHGTVTKDGYGLFSVRVGENRRAHRVAWELTYGPIPPRLFILHRCDNPLCVRPAHLFLGTARDNSRDAQQKGRLASGDRNGARLHPERLARGEAHARSTLTEAQVQTIRERAAAGAVNYSALARLLGVPRWAVYDVVHGRTWRHLL